VPPRPPPKETLPPPASRKRPITVLRSDRMRPVRAAARQKRQARWRARSPRGTGTWRSEGYAGRTRLARCGRPRSPCGEASPPRAGQPAEALQTPAQPRRDPAAGAGGPPTCARAPRQRFGFSCAVWTSRPVIVAREKITASEQVPHASPARSGRGAQRAHVARPRAPQLAQRARLCLPAGSPAAPDAAVFFPDALMDATMYKARYISKITRFLARSRHSNLSTKKCSTCCNR
jgi:hypothetical protein